MTIEELAAGLRGKALTDAIYEDTLGFPPSTPATERTPFKLRYGMACLSKMLAFNGGLPQ